MAVALPDAITASGASASAPTGDGAFRELLSGANKGSMNLAAVEARALDLQRSLDEMLTGLTHNARNISWADTLDRFSVLNVQFQHLSGQLRPLAKHYIAHPKAVDQDPAAARVLPIMLATKLVPDLECRRAAHLDAHRRQAGNASASAQYDSLLEATERFNAGIERLTGPPAATATGVAPEAVGLLHVTGTFRRNIASIGRPTGAKAGINTQLRRAQVQNKNMAKRRKITQSSSLLSAALEGKGLEVAWQAPAA